MATRLDPITDASPWEHHAEDHQDERDVVNEHDDRIEDLEAAPPGGGADPFDGDPEDLGPEADPGISEDFARGDHAHKKPTRAELGLGTAADHPAGDFDVAGAAAAIGALLTTHANVVDGSAHGIDALIASALLVAQGYTDDAFALLLGGAPPAALDTIIELAAALEDDEDAIAALTLAIAGKQAADATLTALAGVATAADRAVYFTATDVAAAYTLTAFARTLSGAADAAAARGILELGTAATRNVPAAGNAGPTEVVKGDDGRLTDARTPTTHTHPTSEVTGLDAILASVDTVSGLLAGIDSPLGALSRWKAGLGPPAVALAEDLDTTETGVDVATAAAFPANVASRLLYTKGGEQLLDAGSGTTTRTMARAVNSSGASATVGLAHVTGDPLFFDQRSTVVVEGDSIPQGTTNGTDAFLDRAFRKIADTLGGLTGKAWPLWRNVDITQSAQEWDLIGTFTPLALTNAYGLGSFGSVIFSAGTGNGAKWTKPAADSVSYLELTVIDDGGTTGNVISYRFDTGAWQDLTIFPQASTGAPRLHTLRIVVPPASVGFKTFEIRAANAAGSSTKAFALPYTNPLVTYDGIPVLGRTGGLRYVNASWDGTKLRQRLNARTALDATVANGSPNVTAPTSVIVTADVGSTIYVGPADGSGQWKTVLSRTDATHLVLSSDYTGPAVAAGAAQVTIIQGDHVGDPLRHLVGDPGSLFPGLVIMGFPTNDQAGTASLGDGSPEAFRAMAQYEITRVNAFADVVVIANYEQDSGVNDALQAAYRQVCHDLVAANVHVTCIDLFEVFAEAGYPGVGTQGPALTAAGLVFPDGVHLSQTGHYLAEAPFRLALGLI